MTVTANKYLEEIANYIPGKSKIEHENPIKLSSNENALKASPKALEAYKNHAADLVRYADGSCSNLRAGLAKKNNIEADQIVCGAGSDEIIALLTMAFAKEGDEIIYSEHGFLMYPISAKRIGAKSVIAKEKNLKTDVSEVLKAISDKTRVIFIANPNNPTGSYLNEEEIETLISNTPKHILIVLDHAYEEFAQNSQNYPNALELAKKYSNVVVTRTFSKIYGLASLRIGWSYSSKYVADILNKVRGPFNVGGPAQFAALEALKDEEFLQKSKDHNDKWLKNFFNKLHNNPVITAHPSIANFVLLDFGSKEACQKANQKLLDAGIILREMSAYKLPNCLRATIGTDVENNKLLEILENL